MKGRERNAEERREENKGMKETENCFKNYCNMKKNKEGRKDGEAE
jgi:hypothetical protein